jgi:MFS family permease
MTPNERNILTATCFGHFMSHFNMLVFPALVLPLSRALNMELADVLPLSFWMYLLFGVTALPWGLLSDKVGAKPLLLLFYLGAGVCALSATAFLDQPAGLALALAGVGFFSGIYHPAGLGLISKGMSRMSMALGYNGMAGNAGLAAAPILTGLVNHFFGLSSAFLLVGILNLTGALIMLGLPAAEPEKRDSRSSPEQHRDMLAGFLVLCLCMVLVGLTYRGMSVILPSYFELRNESLFESLQGLQGLVASKNVAATGLTSLVFLVGILGQYIGGWAAERFDARRGYLLFHALTIPLALLIAWSSDLTLLWISMAYAFFLLGMQPIENTLIARLTPDRLRHSGFGLKFILNFGIGSLAVFFVGWVESVWSLPAVFVALAGLSCLLVLCILGLFTATSRLHI